MADQFLTLLEQEKPSILALLPKLNEWLTPDRWWSITYDVVRRRDLYAAAQKNPVGMIAALKKVADWGLELDGEEAFLNVYADEIVPQAMYKGLIRRAVEAGAVAHAVADVIKEGDSIEESIGPQGRTLKHLRQFGRQNGKRSIVGAYALFWLPNGIVDYELMEADDLERIKAAALRMARRHKKDAELSPAWRFFEGEMSKKSVLRRGLKRMRGKRDGEASRRFEAAMAPQRFDAETTAEELPADDLPQGVEIAPATPSQAQAEPGASVRPPSDAARSATSSKGPRDGGPDAVPGQHATPKSQAGQPSHDRALSDAEADDLKNQTAEMLHNKGVRYSEVEARIEYVLMGFTPPLSTLSELTLSQIPQFVAAVEEHCSNFG